VVEEGTTRGGAKGLGRWLARIAPKRARGSVTVAILSDSRVRTLSRKYRGKDEPTDGLSFPAEMAPGAFFRTTQKGLPEPFLGDIAISCGIAQKQSKLLGHSLTVEVRVLALHGLLHLLGYDHEGDRGQMARAEARLRRKAGLPLGLIARGTPHT
jgi:probable rRNA maturation factor